jgi:polysaccharide biosynthesis protein PslG
MNVIADEGVKWVRMDMEDWNMSEFQDMVSRANARGLCVFGNIMANASGTHWADPTDHQAWANAAANEVSQLKGSVHVWEIWNEENTGSFWPGGNMNSFADLLHKTYLAIKAVDPNAVVISGGNAPNGDQTNPLNSVNVLKDWYNWNKSQGRQGSSQLFDAVAHHPYSYPYNPTDPANLVGWDAFYQTLLLHQVMADPNYGGPTNDGAKKIWGTEGGFPSGCPSGITNLNTCISLTTAASWVSSIMDYWINNWGSFTGPFMWYEVQNQPNISTDREGYFGFIDANWNPKQNQYNNLKAYSALP